MDAEQYEALAARPIDLELGIAAPLIQLIASVALRAIPHNDSTAIYFPMNKTVLPFRLYISAISVWQRLPFLTPADG